MSTSHLSPFAGRLLLPLLFLLSPAWAQSVEFAWEPTGLSGGGAIFCPAVSPVDPDSMMVNCDMSGAYISRDGGRTWEMIHCTQLRGNTRCRPAFHPKDRKVIYAASGYWGRLKVTRDGGKTWNFIGDLPSGLAGEIALDPDAPNRMLAGRVDGRVWLSLDGGKHWRRCPGPRGRPLGFHFDRTSSLSRRVCFAATAAGIWRSDDGGKTWKEKTSGLPWKEIRAFAGGSNKAKGLVVLYCSVTAKVVNGRYAGGIYKSTDRGEHWTSAMGAGINKDIRAYDKWADGSIARYRHVLTSDRDPLVVYGLNESTGFWPPHHNAVWRSADGGRTWKATFYSDPRFKKYNVEYNWRTGNLGRNYQSAGFGAAICSSDPDRLLFTDDFCYVTHDGGKHWFNGHSKWANPPALKEKSRWACTGLVVTTTWHYYVDPFDRDIHYIAYTDIGFARSTDGGATWNWWGDGRWTPWRNTCYEMAFDPEVRGKIWGAFSNVHDIPNGNIILGRHRSTGPGGVCLSLDHGGHWKTSNRGLPVAPVTSIVLDPRSPKGARVLYAGVWGFGVYKSTDGGASWARASAGLGDPSNMRVCRVRLHPDGTLFALITAKRVNGVFLSKGVGLWKSADGGRSWSLVNRNRVFYWPKDFALDPGDSKVAYLGVADTRTHKQGGLYRTKDGGKSWTLLARKGPEHFGAYLDPRRKGWIYATLTEGAPRGGLWLSRDGGKTFQELSGLPFANAQRVQFDPEDDQVIYVTTFGGSVWKGRLLHGRRSRSSSGCSSSCPSCRPVPLLEGGRPRPGNGGFRLAVKDAPASGPGGSCGFAFALLNLRGRVFGGSLPLGCSAVYLYPSLAGQGAMVLGPASLVGPSCHARASLAFPLPGDPRIKGLTMAGQWVVGACTGPSGPVCLEFTPGFLLTLGG